MANIKVRITPKAYQKLRCYVDECPTEISGFGKVRELKIAEDERHFEIYDVEIIPQTVTGYDANMTVEDIGAYLTDKIRKKERVQDIKLWWHSHADFETFFSSTDEDTIDSSREFPYLISLVTNHKGDCRVRLDLYKPTRISLEADFIVGEPIDERSREKLRKEIDSKVKLKRFNEKPWWQRGFGFGSNNYGDDFDIIPYSEVRNGALYEEGEDEDYARKPLDSVIERESKKHHKR